MRFHSFLDGDGQPRYGLAVQDAELWQALLASPGAYVLAGLLGALWGSFANVCIYRMPPSQDHPNGRSVVVPGSHCFACGSPVRWYDNVPILAYLWLRGRCRDCGAEFSPRYLLVEGASVLLFVAVYHYVVGLEHSVESPSQQMLRAAIYWAFVWALLVITFIDLDHKLILNRITYPAVPLFYALGLLLPGGDVWRGLVGIAIGYGTLRIISDVFWLVFRREGMGLGDAKLMAIVGAFLGWQGVVVALFAGSLIGSVSVVPLLLWSSTSRLANAPSGERRLLGTAIPFGPFLAAGALFFLFAQSWLRVQFSILWV